MLFIRPRYVYSPVCWPGPGRLLRLLPLTGVSDMACCSSCQPQHPASRNAITSANTGDHFYVPPSRRLVRLRWKKLTLRNRLSWKLIDLYTSRIFVLQIVRAVSARCNEFTSLNGSNSVSPLVDLGRLFRNVYTFEEFKQIAGMLWTPCHF